MGCLGSGWLRGSLDNMEGPARPIAQSWVVPGRNRATCKRRPVVDKDTTYVALDDSKRKIVAGILRPSDTQPELREIANDARQIRRLFERLKREGPVAACYEAGVSGYDLHRQITGLGVACAVIAPALTPRRPGQRIKTDRRDAAKLVRLFRAGELTAIHVLDESAEAVRDLVRCRDDIRRDVLRWRHRVLKLLARHGHAYLAGKNWSHTHWRWIREQRFDLPPLQRAFEATVFALEQALARLAELDKELEAVAATARHLISRQQAVIDCGCTYTAASAACVEPCANRGRFRASQRSSAAFSNLTSLVPNLVAGIVASCRARRRTVRGCTRRIAATSAGVR